MGRHLVSWYIHQPTIAFGRSTYQPSVCPVQSDCIYDPYLFFFFIIIHRQSISNYCCMHSSACWIDISQFAWSLSVRTIVTHVNTHRSIIWVLVLLWHKIWPDASIAHSMRMLTLTYGQDYDLRMSERPGRVHYF